MLRPKNVYYRSVNLIIFKLSLIKRTSKFNAMAMRNWKNIILNRSGHIAKENNTGRFAVIFGVT